MALRCSNLLLAVISLWVTLGRAEALGECELCYVLDGILFVYGIILTALYCRLKISSAKKFAGQKKQPAKEDLYTGLKPHAEDTYTTIGIKQ
ncbi:high affinity immunoglobulin epsilon receptor subunit gamma [Nerophis lumbriciformis]|uniref:high affinity immunoglobulin epsilon receptor subunit gamma n=1 Tax=Nerophis lumbriciformis TaxID=546530 RepID=UPI002AE06C8A|nr:high affinity immunoglobulin epsilon receptor subunit gamma-like [Nerophis lumbriciformis]XP_061816336.1 high affinity immunoglobulin epsilon receptor subunit gamma-like [Nerophis lumbriciformis]